MRAYIYSIVCVAAAGGIVLIIAPEGIRGGIKKHLKLICALFLLCIMISPATELLSSIKELGNIGLGNIDRELENELQNKYENIYESYLEGSYRGNIGQAVKECLFEKFGVPQDECRVEVSFYDSDEDGVREPSRITVIYSGRSIYRNPRETESYVSGLFKCECVCAIE